MTRTPGSWLRGARLRGARLAAVATLVVLATGCWTTESTPSATVTVHALKSFTLTGPANATAGTAFTVTVTAKDAAGSTLTGYRGTVHFLNYVSDPLAVLPADYTFVAGDNGTHTFTNAWTEFKAQGQAPVVVNVWNTVVNGPAVTGSYSLTVTAGTAAKLGFTQQPNGGALGVAWTTQPNVAIQDTWGNTVTTSSASVTLSIATGTSGAVLTCTTNPLAAASGIATFAGCKINLAGNGYTLRAIATGLTLATSNAFNIT